VHPHVDELVVSQAPGGAEIATARRCATDAAAIVVGTIAAGAGSAQADLVDALLATGRPVVTASLRTPWDLLAYPDARTHLCTYSVLPDSLEALALALVGRLEPSGKLPVQLGNLYPVGHGL
jgi:beta-N-acetylhexosaminidase